MLCLWQIYFFLSFFLSLSCYLFKGLTITTKRMGNKPVEQDHEALVHVSGRIRLCVCSFVNVITSKRFNTEWWKWKLVRGCTVQKVSAECDLGVINPTRVHTRQNVAFFSWVILQNLNKMGRRHSTNKSRDDYAGGKISVYCLVSKCFVRVHVGLVNNPFRI